MGYKRAMTRSATASWSWASALLATSFTATSLWASPAAAQRVVTDETVTAGDVARAPLEDLNLSKDPIPRALLRAREAPYANNGLDDCAEVRSEIGDLDAVLGEDFDTGGPQEKEGLQPGRIAKGLLTALIPYRSVIREVSGANDHAELFGEAIAAGMMRRAYLKGLGEAMDCPYPARPAPPELIARTILPPQAPEQPQEPEEATDGREVPVAPPES